MGRKQSTKVRHADEGKEWSASERYEFAPRINEPYQIRKRLAVLIDKRDDLMASEVALVKMANEWLELEDNVRATRLKLLAEEAESLGMKLVPYDAYNYSEDSERTVMLPASNKSVLGSRPQYSEVA
jgi:hypothetical protein